MRKYDLAFSCISKGVTQVSGVEQDATCRKIALEQHGVFLKPESELPDFKDAAFDVITLWHVLEHVHNLDETIRNFYDKLNGLTVYCFDQKLIKINVINLDEGFFAASRLLEFGLKPKDRFLSP